MPAKYLRVSASVEKNLPGRGAHLEAGEGEAEALRLASRRVLGGDLITSEGPR